MEHEHRAEASLDAALHRALGVLLTPFVVGAGLLASRGGPAGVWGLAVLLAVLAAAAVVAVAGVWAVVTRARQRRRSTATTLPSTVASSPGIGS